MALVAGTKENGALRCSGHLEHGMVLYQTMDGLTSKMSDKESSSVCE
jgi:hypothetical protein